MKKTTYVGICLPFLLLTSCGVGVGDSSSSITPSSTTSSQVDSIETSSEQSQINQDQVIASPSWDNSLLRVLSQIVGDDNAKEVPEVQAENFLSYWSVDSSTNIPIAVVGAYGVRESSVATSYETSLKEKGFALSSENPYGYKEVSVTDDLVIQYELRTDKEKKTYFEIMVYLAKMRIADFPKDQILTVTGIDLPKVEAKSYEFFSSMDANYNPYIVLYAYHSATDYVTSYATILKNSGYTVTLDSSNYYDAVSKNGLYHITFGNYYDEAFYLKAESDWPTAYIKETLGFNLPVPLGDSLNVTYGFVGENETLAVYLNSVTKDSLTSYGSQLEETGWTFLEEKENSGSTLTITTRSYDYKNDDGEIKSIDLLYCLEQTSLCIAIY